MTGVAVYMEGGGDGRDSKAALRQGMSVFLDPLKQAARARSWPWKLVCCGGRQEAFAAFVHAMHSGDNTVVALLVDAEAPVVGPPRAHLQAADGWDLSLVRDDMVHLMIQTMEAWIVADHAALAMYYGQRFNRNALPSALNLETVPKIDLASALDRATRSTQKGAYHKISHASHLLQKIDRRVVQQRCPSCKRLFDALDGAIAAA
jgi:hypothetical protein